MPRQNIPLSGQKGHLTGQEKLDKQLAEEYIKCIGAEQLENPPTWLRDSTAKKEWKRLVEQFKALGVITNLDLNNLGVYCNAYSNYLEATKRLKKEELTVKHTNKSGATNVVENPLINIQLKYSDEIKRYSSLLGLTLDSRLKIANAKLQKDKKDIADEFGDI